MYVLIVIGYMGNNVFFVRVGDAICIVLMGLLVKILCIKVMGMFVVEWIFDVVVLLVLFVVVGYGLFGEVGGDSIEIIVVVVVGGVILVVLVWWFICYNECVMLVVMSLVLSMLGLCKVHHGLLLFVMMLLIWVIEVGVWMLVGVVVGFGMDLIEGFYLVALVSVFLMILFGFVYVGM